nr:MAG TPA: hypothetical protein [Caudoviricetes sp.]
MKVVAKSVNSKLPMQSCFSSNYRKKLEYNKNSTHIITV